MSHKYSLDEIDRMRAVLRRVRNADAPPIETSTKIGERSELTERYLNAYAHWSATVEEELRTLMIGGVRPDELEAKYPVGPNPAVGGSAVVTVPWDSAVDYNPQLAEFLSGEEPTVIKGGLVGEADRRS